MRTINFIEDNIINKYIVKLKKSLRSYDKRKGLPKKFIFLCGEDINNKNNDRKEIIKYLETSNSNNKCLIAEKLYLNKINLLEFENLLAEMSDEILIILNSPGTFCELGAFVNKSEIQEKLYVINEDNPEFERSFITKGPLNLLNDHVCYYTGELINSNNVKNFLNKVKVKGSSNIKHNGNKRYKSKIYLKPFINEVINIISIFGPISEEEVEFVYKELFDIKYIRINGFSNYNVSQILKLLWKMQLIEYKNKYYFCKKNLILKNYMFKFTETQIDSMRSKYLCYIHKDSNRIGAII